MSQYTFKWRLFIEVIMKTGVKASIIKREANWVPQNPANRAKKGLAFLPHQSYHVDASRIIGGRKDESYGR